MASTDRLRIAAFGFRSLPPSDGGAGADKFALELLPRLAQRGHEVIAYNRVYPKTHKRPPDHEFRGVKVRSFRTISWSGFDTIVHGAKVTWDIIRNDTADIVHIQNGGNSLFAAVLRLFGKRTYLSQDGLDWERDKWPWYGKVFLRAMAYLTARVHNEVIFDNIFAREHFEKRFGRKYAFVPFGSDVDYAGDKEEVFQRLGVEPGKYMLFVGRFIPDKGLHYLVPAFEKVKTDKKLVLVGGSPNPSPFERKLRKTRDDRIVFPGYIYGPEMHTLMKNCYTYIQPSDVEGLSPVILESSYLGAPVVCSDIEQNQYILDRTGMYFRQGDVDDLAEVLQKVVDDEAATAAQGREQRERITTLFSWEAVTDQHVAIFQR